MIRSFYKQALEEGHQHINVLLRRVHEYVTKDRYETKEQALEIDNNVASMLGTHYVVVPNERGLNQFYELIEEKYDTARN